MNDEVTIYGFAGSHPCEAVYGAAKYKGIEFRRVFVPPAIHRVIMRVKFGGYRVPAAKTNATKAQGTSMFFPAPAPRRPAPPLYPSDIAEREAVIAAERWGEADFQ